jgi:fructose-specific phosphotransferase system IIC component
MRKSLSKVKQYLLSGVSYAIPFVASGGILIALAITFAPMTANGPDFSHSPILKIMMDIGAAAFTLLVPVLAGYIAFGMADRPGLVPGFVGGMIASTIGAGFLGGLVAGLLAGYIVMLLKKIKVPRYIKPVMPILVIPVISSLIVGFVMYKVIGYPIKDIMTGLTIWLNSMGQGNKVILALVLGAMISFDMGGPVNKTAFFFGVAMIQNGNFAPMGAVAAAICVPPLSMGLATLMARKLWTEQERDAGYAALGMGMIGITEGAIPFAASDPIRVIPSIMVGSMLSSTIAMIGNVGDHAPHGGPIVIPVVDNRIMYIVAIIVGSLVAAICINLLKKFGNKN